MSDQAAQEVMLPFSLPLISPSFLISEFGNPAHVGAMVLGPVRGGSDHVVEGRAVTELLIVHARVTVSSGYSGVQVGVRE